MTDPLPAGPAPLRRDEAALRFLRTRRSRSARTLAAPGPDAAQLAPLLETAVRSPDHGKLEPWRFAVISGAARDRVAATARHRATALGMDDAAVEKTAAAFGYGPLIVAVISCPKPSAKIPRWEQEMSAGAVCLALLNAALASGWGANWLTGPLVRDETFLAQALGCAAGEVVAGFIHIGTETTVPADRPRPDVERITLWL